MEIALDGEILSDPMGQLRRHNKGAKRGRQYITQLDLSSLEPGPHELQLRFRKRWRSPHTLSVTFEYDPYPHQVRLHVTDQDGRPLSARVTVRRKTRPVRQVDGAAWKMDPKSRDSKLDSVFVLDGQASLRLHRGRYRFIASRGLRYDLAVVEQAVDQDEELHFALPLVVDTPGVIAADLHVHSCASYDAFLPHRSRLASIAASGLDLAVITDHNRVTDLEPLGAQVFGAEDGPWLLPGVEADVRSGTDSNWDRAHLTVMPLRPGEELPSRHRKRIGRALETWRQHQRDHPHSATGQDVLLSLAHPRGIQFRPGQRPREQAWALFNNMGFQREIPVGEGPNAWMTRATGDGGSAALDFDAIEVINRSSLRLYRQVRTDWFALLCQGHDLTGLGNSDSHAMAVELVGMPRNLVAGGLAEDGSLDVAAFIQAIRQGRVQVTSGPVLDLQVSSGGQQAGQGELLLGARGPTRVSIRLRAPSWIPVHELRLVRDGRVAERIQLSGQASVGGPHTDETFVFDLDATRDTWLLAEAGWPEARDDHRVGGLYAEVAPDYVPLAFTNPVRIDADGDGRFTPPGL